MTKIFLFGEGDFSFCHSLGKLPEENDLEIEDLPEIPIIATSLDTRQEVVEKYPSFVHRKFDSRIKILHGVNALDRSVWEQYIDKETVVIWNHPHLGVEDSVQHFQLLCHLFHLLDQFSPHSFIISLLAGQVDRWRVQEAANRSGFDIVKFKRMFEANFPGFECRRNLSGSSFKTSQSWLDSWFLWFGRKGESLCDISPILNKDVEEAEKNENYFQCDLCERKYTSFLALKTHVSQIHQLKKFQLDLNENLVCCGKTFDSQYAINMHNRSVHGDHVVSTKRLKLTEENHADEECSICGSRDRDHVLKFGTNRKLDKLRCEKCDKEFKDLRALNQHLNYKH